MPSKVFKTKFEQNKQTRDSTLKRLLLKNVLILITKETQFTTSSYSQLISTPGTEQSILRHIYPISRTTKKFTVMFQPSTNPRIGIMAAETALTQSNVRQPIPVANTIPSTKILSYIERGTGVKPERNRSGTGVEPERNRSGTGAEPEWNRSGTGAEPEWNRSGTGVEPERNRT